MAQQEDTLMAWLDSLSCGVTKLEDILDPENHEIANVVEMITGIDASECPIQMLERWLERKKCNYVIDNMNAVSVATAALGAAAIYSDDKEEYIRKIMKLDEADQKTLMILIKEFNEQAESSQVDQYRAILRAREEKIIKLQQHTVHIEDDAQRSLPVSNTVHVDLLTQSNERIRELERKVKHAETHREELEEVLAEKNIQAEKAMRTYEDQIASYEEELRLQADDLDVARSKAAELSKAELRIQKLMKAAEEGKAYRNELLELKADLDARSMESRAGAVDVDSNAMIVLKQQLENCKNKVVDLEVQLGNSTSAIQDLEEELALANSKIESANDRETFLKEQLETSKASVAQLEQELELAAENQSPHGFVSSQETSSINPQVVDTLKQEKESLKTRMLTLDQRITELDSQNKALQDELKSAHDRSKDEHTSDAHSDQTHRLKEQLKEKMAECVELEVQKNKLQVVVKQLFGEYQQKADKDKARFRQEIKDLQAKLAAKEHQVTMFKSIRDEDQETHRREQRMMASSLYELGLEMQRRSAMKSHQGNEVSWLVKRRGKI